MMTLCKLRGKILLLVQLWWIIVEIAEKAREFGPKNDGLRLLKSSSYVMQLLARWYEIGDTWGERKALWSHIWRVTGKLFQQIVRHESEFLIQLTMRSWTKRRRTAELTKTSGRWRQERVAKKGLFSVPKPCLLSFVMSLNRSSIKVCLLMKMHSESKSSTITPWAMTDPFLLNRLLLLYFLLGWSILKLLLHTICSEKRLMMMDKLQHSIASSSQIFQRCQIPTIIKVLRQLK